MNTRKKKTESSKDRVKQLMMELKKERLENRRLKRLSDVSSKKQDIIDIGNVDPKKWQKLQKKYQGETNEKILSRLVESLSEEENEKDIDSDKEDDSSETNGDIQLDDIKMEVENEKLLEIKVEDENNSNKEAITTVEIIDQENMDIDVNKELLKSNDHLIGNLAKEDTGVKIEGKKIDEKDNIIICEIDLCNKDETKKIAIKDGTDVELKMLTDYEVKEPKSKCIYRSVFLRTLNEETGTVVTFTIKTANLKDEEKQIISCSAEGDDDNLSVKSAKNILNKKERFQVERLKNPSVILLFDNLRHTDVDSIVKTSNDNYIDIIASIESRDPDQETKQVFFSGTTTVTNLHCGYCGFLFYENFFIDSKLEPTCTCPYCFKNFSNNLRLKFHQKSYFKKMPCLLKDECSFKCRSKPILDKHATTEHSEIVCSQCGKEFKDQHNYLNHQYQHKKNRIMRQCKYCKVEFPLCTLYHHIDQQHKKNERIKCPIDGCHVVLKEFYLKHHIRKVHSEEGTKICNVCGKQVKASYFQDHEKIHERETEKVKCNFCDMTFISEETREKHESYRHHYMDRNIEQETKVDQVVDDSDIMIRCFVDDCDFTCLVPKDMTIHYQTCHSLTNRKQMKFRCAHKGCSFLGVKKYNVNVHFKRSHARAISYPCELCGKRMASNAGLARHMLIHTGEQPFGCAVCKRRFNQCTARNNHEKRVHKYLRPPGTTTMKGNLNPEELNRSTVDFQESDMNDLVVASVETIIVSETDV